MAILEPWLTALRSIGRLTRPWDPKTLCTIQETRILWVLWPAIEELTEIEPSVARQAHEALEMLAILSKNHSFDAWAKFLMLVWPEDAPKWLNQLPRWGDEPIHVGCWTNVQKMPECFVPWAQTYMMEPVTNEVALRQASLRSCLAEAFPIDFVAAATTSVAVPLYFELYPCGVNNRADSTTLLYQLLGVVRQLHRSRPSETEEIDPIFHSRFLLHEIWIMENVDWFDFEYVDELVGYGIRVDFLPMNDFTLEGQEAVKYTPMLRNVFAANVANNRWHGTSVVDVVSTMDPSTASAIFSALLDSRSIREIYISASENRQRTDIRVWEWFALSVFSCQATNQLDRILLDVQHLTLDDLAAMELLFRSANPLGAYYGNPNQKILITSASTFRLSDTPGEGQELSFGSDPLQVRVVDDRPKEWVGVLLPGFGRAWVPRSQCQLSSPQETGLLRAVRNIRIQGFNENNASLAFRMLRMIGGGTTHVHVEGNMDSDTKIRKDWVIQILREWPDLETFKLTELDVGTLEIFSECFDQGITKIHELSIEKFYGSTISIFPLFLALADESKVMTQSLTKLCVHLRMPIAMAPEIRKSLHHLLSSNCYLQEVDVIVNYSTGADRYLGELNTTAYKQYDGQIVRGRGGSALLTHKLALLSVVREAIHSGEGLVGQLDADALSRIFEFIAQPKTRRVHVSFRKW